jgi:NYN domain
VDRYAIFVDVGYVVASVAELLAGSAGRHLVSCDYGQLVSSLVAEAGAECGMPFLRTYWYDASMSGQPEHDQLTVADLPGVRLRLGRLVRGEQKGVDSRLVRDLIVLARDRAMAAAYLLAGDEDICEGVAEAQDHGVRVTVLGVPGVNQSRLLMQQSDEHRVLPEEFWRGHFRVLEPARERPAPAVPVRGEARVEIPAERPRGGYDAGMLAAFARATERGDGADSVGALLRQTSAEVEAFEERAAEAGRDFARELLLEATPLDIERLLKITGWQVPRDLDVRLLRFAEQRVGYLWERPELKPIVRSGFWDEFRRTAASRVQAG